MKTRRKRRALGYADSARPSERSCGFWVTNIATGKLAEKKPYATSRRGYNAALQRASRIAHAEVVLACGPPSMSVYPVVPLVECLEQSNGRVTCERTPDSEESLKHDRNSGISVNSYGVRFDGVRRRRR